MVSIEKDQGHKFLMTAGLSPSAVGMGIPLAKISLHDPLQLSQENNLRKIEPKELPSCSISCLLINCICYRSKLNSLVLKFFNLG